MSITSPRKAATIEIVKFNPIELRIDTAATKKVKTNQYVQVFLPRIESKRYPDRRIPRLGIQINVKKPEDERLVEDFAYLIVSSESDLYKHWKNREKEINTGIYIGDVLIGAPLTM
jgi:hypothetical protein